MRITVWDPSRKVNHLSEVICDRKIITEFTRLISSTRIGKPVLIWTLKSPKTKILADRLIERTPFMLDETELKNVHKAEGDQ